MCYKRVMKRIYLSPHLDDAAFSCGGLIWEQSQAGDEVEIWTICAGDPADGDISPFAESLHQAWGFSDEFIRARREEDQKAAQILGAVPRYFPYLDCIYRKSPTGHFYYLDEGDLFGGLDQDEMDLIDHLTADLQNQLPEDAVVVAPLGIGNHVDHQLTRKAASRLEFSVTYYPDYPYVREPEGKEILGVMAGSEDWIAETHPISEAGILKWHLAALAYRSQIPIFWENQVVLQREIRGMTGPNGVLKLWNPVESG
jgi:LmbE family N-acetylglucosaminyl deacetylase